MQPQQPLDSGGDHTIILVSLHFVVSETTNLPEITELPFWSPLSSLFFRDYINLILIIFLTPPLPVWLQTFPPTGPYVGGECSQSECDSASLQHFALSLSITVAVLRHANPLSMRAQNT